MAKPIKFNLICDEYPVRTLTDLQNHFCIEDVLKYYKNDLLQRWLSVRGYDKELNEVRKIDQPGDLEIVTELIRIFNIETDPLIVARDTYILGYKQENIEKFHQFKEQKSNVEDLINNYNEGYQNVINTILSNSTDIAIIKAAVKEINDKYLSIFEIDYEALFNVFFECAPLALFVMLTFDEMRKKYILGIPDDSSEKEENSSNTNAEVSSASALKTTFSTLAQIQKVDEARNEEKKTTKTNATPEVKTAEQHEKALNKYIEKGRSAMYHQLVSLMSALTLVNILGDNLKKFSGPTDGYWKDLEDNEHKYMILRMEEGNNVRSLGNREQTLTSTDITNKFVILDGVDYRSQSNSDVLFYMEV